MSYHAHQALLYKSLSSTDFVVTHFAEARRPNCLEGVKSENLPLLFNRDAKNTEKESTEDEETTR